MKLIAPGDPAAGTPGHDEQNTVAHFLTDHGKEIARQIRAAPFARTGFHIKREEGVPHGFGQIGAGQPADLNSCAQRFLALALYGFAFA
jgi:hypothetical protein